MISIHLNFRVSMLSSIKNFFWNFLLALYTESIDQFEKS